MIFFFFLFNYAATTEIYTDGHTLSLHHALPSCLVEKPKPQDAPATLSIIGRYVLLPEVFEHLGKRQRGAGGEIQLTDAMARMLGRSPFHGLRFDGRRFDCGDKIGFFEANVAFALARDDLGGEI